METNRDQWNEPLAHHLWNAAMDRSTAGGERVDDFVLDEDGVLDLRDLDRDPTGASVADPAKALATIRGQLGNAHEVSELYDESEPAPSRWRLGLRARHAFAAESSRVRAEPRVEAPIAPPSSMPPLSRLSLVPLAEETPTAITPAAAPESPEPPEPPAAPEPMISKASSIRPEIDLREEARPTADCPKCMGLGRRDLFDRFSQVEFYSCDNCMHMWQQELR